MTSKKTSSSRSKSPKQSASPRKPTVKSQDAPASEGAPIEHYRGEPKVAKRTGSAGSLEEETLDRNAPFNKTYGIKEE